MKKTCDNCDVKHMRFSCKCGVENGICLGWIADYETLENEVKELKRKLEICKVALGFYAMPRSWHENIPEDNNIYEEYKEITDDDCYVLNRDGAYIGGLSAIKALKEMGE